MYRYQRRDMRNIKKPKTKKKDISKESQLFSSNRVLKKVNLLDA